jgi:hypothetical protein
MTGSLKSRKLARRLPASLRFGALFAAAGISVLASSGPPASDEFNSTVLNSSLWAFTNPAGGSFTLNGTNLLLSAPGGATHDPTATGSDNAVRMMQAIGNVDFDVNLSICGRDRCRGRNGADQQSGRGRGSFLLAESEASGEYLD